MRATASAVRPRRLAPLIAAAALQLGGCAVGPNFHTPASPIGAGYAPGALPTITTKAAVQAGAAQRLVSGEDVRYDWWTAFQSPELDRLVALSLRANPTIEAAKAALSQARDLTRSAEGGFFPTLQGDFSPSRNKTATGALSPASANGSPYYSLYTAQLTVSYTPDIFGGIRRQVESLAAQAEMQRFELEAAGISLANNVVAAAVQEASTRAQIAANEDIIRINTDALQILRNQQRFGYAMGIDVAAQEAALAQAQQTMPPLQKQLAINRDLLRALVGNLPNQDVDATFTLASLHLPEDLPLSLPSKIVEQRPDVLAAAQQMRSANANVGVTIAAMLPQFTLSANGGSAANAANALFTPGNQFWSLSADVAQTLFDGGVLLYKRRAADEALVQAAAQYRSTVLTAFQNVADTLHTLLTDATALQAASAAEAAAERTLDLTRRQSQVGYVNYLTLITAEQAYQTALLTRIQAQTNRLSDTAALFQALGGGWWNRPQDKLAAR